MAEGIILGDGVIRVSADRTAFDAGIAQAKSQLQEFGRTVGDSVAAGSAKAEAALGKLGKTFGASAEAGTTRAQRQLDAYIAKVEASNARIGKSFADSKVAEFAQRGVGDDQLARLAAVLKTNEALKVQLAEEKKLAAERAARAAKLPGVTAGLVSTIQTSVASTGNSAGLDAEALAAQRATQAQKLLAATRASAAAELRRTNPAADQLDIEAAAAQKAAKFQQALANIRTASQDAARRDAQAGQSLIASLEAEAGAIGKTRSELLALRAAKLGVADQAAPFIAALRKEEQVLGGFHKSSRLLAVQQQQLGFQLHDFAVQIAGGQNPLLAFVQQGTQLSGIFGGAKNALSAVLALFTPMRIAIGGVAGVAATLGVALFKGAEQSRALADAILLTGNAAGITEGRFNSLAQSVAAATQRGTGAARESAQALLGTGEIGPQVFTAATEAAVRFGEATGQTADEVAKDFAGMSRDVVKWTTEHNRQLHLVSLAQFEQIKALAEGGRSAEAQAIVYDVLNQRLRGMDGNLGSLQRLLVSGRKLWDDWWDAAKGLGRAETAEDRLAAVSKRLAEARDAQQAAPGVGAADINAFSGKPTLSGRASVARLEAEQIDLSRRVLREQDNAAAEADRAADRAAAISANEAVDATLKRAKAQGALNDALAKGRQQLAALNAERQREGRQPLSDADQKAFLDQIRKENTPQGAGNEAAQVLRANLQRDLRSIGDALELERDDFAAHNRLMQGELQAGNVSFAQFYADRIAGIQASVGAEIAALDKERARLEQFKRETKDPSERAQTQGRIDDIDAQQGRLRRQVGNEVADANRDQAASFRELQARVIDYRAQLLQLQGDEVGAARLRAQAAIETARVLSAQAQPNLTPGDFTRFERGGPVPAGNPVDVAAQKKVLDQQTNLLAAKTETSNINQRLQIEEERIALAQRTGALTENAALAAQGEARQRAVAALEEQIRKQEEIANDPIFKDNLQLKIDTSRARLELEKLKAELDPLKQKFDSLFKEAGTSAFTDLLNGRFGQVDQSKLSQKLSDINTEFDRREQRIRDNGGSLADINRNERERKAAEAKARSDAQPGFFDQFRGAAGAFGTQIAQAFNAETAKGLSESLFGKGGLFEGAGSLASSIFGGKAGPAKSPAAAASDSVATSFTSLQATGIDPATASLQRLQTAADGAAGSLGPKPEDLGINAAGAGFSAAKDTGFTGEQSVAGLLDEAGKAQGDAATKTEAFGLSTQSAAADVVRLATAASQGGNALALLPSIISLIQASVATSGGGSGSGIGGFLAGLFGGSGSSAGAGASAGAGSGLEGMSSEELAFFFHDGGIVGQHRDLRPVNPGVFQGAPKFHGGGLVARAPAIAAAPRLAGNEVAAILMGGPKGTREEVLRADDPRHRDNIAPALLQRLHGGETMLDLIARRSAGDKTDPGLFAIGAARRSDASPVAAMLRHDKQQRDMSPLTRFLVGSPETVRSLIAELSRESEFESVTSLRELHVAGRRELGGPVSAGGRYEVAERGRPEVLEVAGRNYLLMGNQGGKVTPVADGGQTQQTNNFHFSVAGPIDRRSQSQIAAAAMRGVLAATRRNS